MVGRETSNISRSLASGGKFSPEAISARMMARRIDAATNSAAFGTLTSESFLNLINAHHQWLPSL